MLHGSDLNIARPTVQPLVPIVAPLPCNHPQGWIHRTLNGDRSFPTAQIPHLDPTTSRKSLRQLVRSRACIMHPSLGQHASICPSPSSLHLFCHDVPHRIATPTVPQLHLLTKLPNSITCRQELMPPVLGSYTTLHFASILTNKGQWGGAMALRMSH